MISGGLAGGGTTQKNDPVVTTSMDIIDILNFIGNLLKPLADALRAAGKALSWIKNIGRLIAGIVALVTYVDMLQKTGCQVNAIAAGLLDLVLNLLAGALIAFLVSGFGILGVIFTVLIVTIFFMIIEDILLEIIAGVKMCYKYFKRELYAKIYFLSKFKLARMVDIYV